MMDWRYQWLRWKLRWQGRRRPPASRETLLEGRELFEAAAELVGPPDGAVCRPVDADGVPAEWMSVPGSIPDRILFYVHGGAYAMGSIAASRTMLSYLLDASAATGFNVEYRLAPEHPFPAGLEDVVTAYRWLIGHVGPGRIVVAGDSAGGGLAVAMLVAARDEGLPMPAACITTSAWADLALDGASYVERARRDVALTVDGLQVAAHYYLDGTDPRHPLASPIHADLHGLPPLLAMVGTDEIVHDDSVRLVAQARRAGVDARLYVADGMIHCWTGYPDHIRQARHDLARFGRFVRAHVPDEADVAS